MKNILIINISDRIFSRDIVMFQEMEEVKRRTKKRQVLQIHARMTVQIDIAIREKTDAKRVK